MAATNHLDQIDAALLRAGRFSEKIEFTAPPEAQLTRFIRGWVQRKQVCLEAGLGPAGIAVLIGAKSIADTQGVLQYALNCAIDRTVGTEAPVIGRSDICCALATVCGAQRLAAVNGLLGTRA